MAKRASGLPPYTYLYRLKYFIYKPYTGGGRTVTRQSFVLKDAQGRPLNAGCAVSAVWTAWGRLQGGAALPTVGWLLERYLASTVAADLSPTTRTEYRRQTAFIKRYPITGGRTFGDILLKVLTPGKFTKYLDARKNDGAPVSGNREVALISIAWSWALARDEVALPNPCKLAQRHKERARTRYVTDEEYAAAFELAGIYRYLRPAMELAYLCRLRQGEVRALKKSDLTERGIDCKRLKGSRDAVTLWSPRLREAVRLAGAIEREVDSIYLLHNANGQPLTKTGFDTAWQRLQARVRKDGMEPFHFHDLKAKGISDFAGDKQAAGGHRTAAMVAIYDRKKPEVDSTR